MEIVTRAFVPRIGVTSSQKERIVDIDFVTGIIPLVEVALTRALAVAECVGCLKHVIKPH